MNDPRPDLRWTTRPEGAEAVVLVLHGGAAKGSRANQWWHLPVLRLLPVANAIARTGGDRLGVARLRFAVRGWNGSGESAVADARWGLEQVRAAYPGLPIGVVGHSMGGRVALRITGDPGVRAVVGLASWVEWGDRAHGGPDVSALLLHGDRDRITPPKGSRHMARELTRLGVDAEYVEIPGEGHAFLRHPSEVDRRTAEWLVERLLNADDAPEQEVTPDAAPEPGRTS
jgi:pimeloyl-ACP methyl ester carboxylesterase